jgi:hypothetical protein
MKTPTRFLLAALAAAALTACPEVQVPVQFGDSSTPLDPALWNGAWMNPSEPDELIELRVDSKNPNVLLGEESDAEEEDDGLVMRVQPLQPSSGEDDLFVAIGINEDRPLFGTPHLISRPDDDVLVFWTVNHAAIEAAIEAGTLQGSLTRPDDKGSHCELEATPANEAELAKPGYWRWTEPLTLYRQGE